LRERWRVPQQWREGKQLEQFAAVHGYFNW
jgi:hypothetical protein